VTSASVSCGHFSRLEKSERAETVQRFLKAQPQVLPCLPASANLSISVGERSRLDEMISDVAGALLDGIGMETRDSVGDAGM
jgi:hypothetical protein